MEDGREPEEGHDGGEFVKDYEGGYVRDGCSAQRGEVAAEETRDAVFKARDA